MKKLAKLSHNYHQNHQMRTLSLFLYRYGKSQFGLRGGGGLRGYQPASEWWVPIHTVETIIVSVISMLTEPNDKSPANVDAAVSIDL